MFEQQNQLFSKAEARSVMNGWGAGNIPFLFIIDFEMKAVRLFRLDRPLPGNVRYDFHSDPLQNPNPLPGSGFRFIKQPMPYAIYEEAFAEIRKQIMNGNSFLTNLTFPTPVETNLTIRQVFELARARYKLLLDGAFVCFSPETFIRIARGNISTYPMKGTIDAAIPQADQIILQDRKELAEHHTVVDLLRNDLSMVATDISVKRFRYIDRIKTHDGDILQVSSEISGRLPSDYQHKLGDIIFTILPAGSVTGAPKPKTVELIRKTEKTDRGYYTGICGIFDGENVDSAVMIRYIEIRGDKMFFRSGGGITFMSDARDEYNELIRKVYVPIA